MKVFFPEYYRTFACIAADCPDSCCHEWTVDVDTDTAAFYRSLSGSLGDRLREVLADTDDGAVMTIENGRCPMWRQDKLCRIQAELGHEALCKTCREFPRLCHDYGNFAELDLELSCPEAARLILSENPYAILSESRSGGEAPEYDEELMALLLESRENALALLEDTSKDIRETLAVLLLYAHDVQAAIDGDTLMPIKPEVLLSEAQKYMGEPDLQGLLSLFSNLEILTDRWRDLLSNPGAMEWTCHIRTLARYMVRRYWLQTVADYDLVCRVKLVIIACVTVAALGKDKIQTAQLFSKEIENDADNVEKILDSAYCVPALTDANLLGLLLWENFHQKAPKD